MGYEVVYVWYKLYYLWLRLYYRKESLYDDMKYVALCRVVSEYAMTCWICCDFSNMVCLVYRDFLGRLGGSSIMGCYLHIALVWVRGFLRWWFLYEVYFNEMFTTYEYLFLCYESYY